MLPAQCLLMILCFGKDINGIFSGHGHFLVCSNFSTDTCILCVFVSVTRSTAAPQKQVDVSFLESIVTVVDSATRRRRRSFLVGLL